MNDARDPFALLGLAPDADDKQIAEAYRRRAREFHPDRHRSDPQRQAEARTRFTDISWAKEQIGTPDKRRQWMAAQAEQRRQQQGLFGVDLSFLDEQRSATTPRHGKDVAANVEMTFEEALRGKQVEISFGVDGPCGDCGGSGARPGTAPRPCPACSGSGVHNVGSVASVCADCQGRRIRVDKPCEPCAGSGRTKTQRVKRVQLLAGISDGQLIRISQQGMPGYQRNGDLVIKATVHPSPIFSRYEDASDLLIEVPVSYAEAALGAAVAIPTPTGRINLRLPPQTSSGALLRVRGQGAPVYGDPQARRGDLFARVMVVVPPALNERQMNLIRQLGVHDDPEGLRGQLFGRPVPASDGT